MRVTLRLRRQKALAQAARLPYGMHMADGAIGSALERLLRPLSRELTVDLARALISIRADEETQARYDELAGKHSSGQLTPEERAELESIVSANTLLGVLKAEARLRLASGAAS